MNGSQQNPDHLRTRHEEAPHYTTRVSRRARHVHLRVSSHDGLEVVVPTGFDEHRIPALLSEHRHWIDRAMARVMKPGTPNRSTNLPNRVELEAIGETWNVLYRPGTRVGIRLREQSEEKAVILSGEIRAATACRAALRRWLLRKARRHLAPWLSHLASERGFEFGRVTIRCQKTRWGSCTRRLSAGKGVADPLNTISLNAQLLFLPSRLVRYVLLHELCHTVEPNHSPAFWALLRRYEPEASALRRELRTAWKLVPGWLIRGRPAPPPPSGGLDAPSSIGHNDRARPAERQWSLP